MTWETWLLFVGSTFFVSAAPGSNMLLAFQYGLNYGFRKTVITLLGLSFGLLLLLSASMLGVAALSNHAPAAFTALKVFGAGYLAWLGVQAMNSGGSGFRVDGIEAVLPSRGELFRKGVWVSLSNPKAILFFVSFFPKFINPKSDSNTQYLILIASFFVIETAWQLVYTLGGKALAGWLQTGSRLLWLNRICGACFMLIAAGLLYDVWAG